ncbi:MAG TPA: DUF1080 domain-containing protein [Bryobacteraceae bacterium]|jgi:hypothetical protein
MSRVNTTVLKKSLFIFFCAAAVITVPFWRPALAQQPSATASPNRAGRGGNANNREPDPVDFEDHDGFTQIFDGQTLNNWDGNPDVWRVENGMIVGESTRDKPAGNTMIVYHGTEAKDFDIKLEMKADYGGGGGIQYRSTLGLPATNGVSVGGGRSGAAGSGRAGAAGASGARVAAPPRNPRWTMIGPQMDFWLSMTETEFLHVGQLYSQNTGLGSLTFRGQVVELEPGRNPRLVGESGDREALGGYNKFQDWNQFEVIVRGSTMIHLLNGRLMTVTVDDDPASSNNVTGLIGIQIEGMPCRISVRNIWLRKFS